MGQVDAAFGAIIIGAGTGGALICTVLFALWGMTRGVESLYANLIMTGGFGGLVAAVAVSWTLARQLPVWRRLLISAVATAGTMLVGLLTILADLALPRYGLLVLAGACLVVIVAAHRVFHAPAEPEG